MTSFHEFLYICLYGIVFVIAVSVVILALNSTSATESVIADNVIQHTSIEGKNETIYVEEEQNYTTIPGSNIITDVITIVEPYNEEQIFNEIIKMKIENYEIVKEDLLDIKNNNKEGIKRIVSKISNSSEYRRVYHYDEDYNITEVNYVKE